MQTSSTFVKVLANIAKVKDTIKTLSAQIQRIHFGTYWVQLSDARSSPGSAFPWPDLTRYAIRVGEKWVTASGEKEEDSRDVSTNAHVWTHPCAEDVQSRREVLQNPSLCRGEAIMPCGRLRWFKASDKTMRKIIWRENLSKGIFLGGCIHRQTISLVSLQDQLKF